MIENTIGVTIDYSASTISRVIIHVLYAFRQQILSHLNHRISNLAIGHTPRKGCTCVTVHHIHEQLNCSLSLI
jgi:hypothetical protein